MIGALTLMIAFIFIPFFSQDLPTLLAGEILCGIPWGVFQTLTTAYASEGSSSPVLVPPVKLSEANRTSSLSRCPSRLSLHVCQSLLGKFRLLPVPSFLFRDRSTSYILRYPP